MVFNRVLDQRLRTQLPERAAADYWPRHRGQPRRRIAPLLTAMAGLWLAALPARAVPPSATVPIRLSYALYGHGFHVMDVEADVTLTEAGYAISLHNHSAGLLGVLMHTDVTSMASGRFDGVQAQPSGFSSAGLSRGAQRSTRITYQDGAPSVQVLQPVDPDRDPVAPAATAHSIDTLSAIAALVRNVARTSRCDGQALLFDGLRLSTLEARTAGEQTVPQNPKSPYAGAALRCDFTGMQIGGFLHGTDQASVRRPQQGTAWLAAPMPGMPRLPIRIVFDNPRFGAATLFLIKAAPGG